MESNSRKVSEHYIPSCYTNECETGKNVPDCWRAAPYLTPVFPCSMRVYVYFNLHKKLWSVRALEGPDKGRILQHAETLCLADCSFRVSEAGRQRVLRERCKNVHAGIVGQLIPQLPADVPCDQHLTYDPYKYASFVDAKTLEPRFDSPYALFEHRRVYIPVRNSGNILPD